MNATLTLVLDIAILIALGATIWHAHRLSKQFARMQADRDAFAQLIAALNAAAARAETAIASFKDAAHGAGDDLQERINAARALQGELDIILQAGDSLAERLQTLAGNSSRAVTEKMPRFGASLPDDAQEQEHAQDERARAALQPRTRAEKELLEALKAKHTT